MGRGRRILRTVIDLAQDVVGYNIGLAQKHLKSLIGQETPPNTSPVTKSPAQSGPTQSLQVPNDNHDDKLSFADALAAYERGSLPWAGTGQTPGFLREGRHITYIDPRHAASFRISDGTHDMQSGRDNIIFPEPKGTIRFPYFAMSDEGDPRLAAFEGRGPRGFQQYLLRGRNGFWMSCPPSVTSCVAVVGESPLDVLAYDMLMPHEGGHHLFALRSGSEKMCADAIRDRIAEGEIQSVIVVTDNDAAGLTYAGKVMNALMLGRDKEAGQKFYRGARVTYHQPAHFMTDWNDVAISRAEKGLA